MPNMTPPTLPNVAPDIFSTIDMQTLIQEYTTSKQYVELYTRDFVSLDNLVDGIPLNKEEGAPFVGDTTLAGLVRSIPRSSLKNLPIFAVMLNGSKNSLNALLLTYLLKKTSFNEDTFGKGLLSTMQIGNEQAFTHGYAPFLVATGSMYNDFGTTMRLLHYMDTYPEPGISDSNESGYHYVVANLTKGRVKKILKEALNNPNTSWNVPALQELLESDPKPTNYSIYQSTARQNKAGEDAGPTYPFITRYETGPFPTIVTFCDVLPDKPLRVIESKSKFGYPRVMYLVIDPAPQIPFGVSRVRLASPNQNIMNIYYGNIASMLLINSKPPIFKRGRFVKPVQLKAGAVWEALDATASAELKNLDNGSLAQFVEMAQQFAGQIQNIMGTPTGTINGGNNQFGFSKTAPGVQMQQSVKDDSTNQITKILENFLRQYALSALDVLLSEQTGDDVIIVDDETANAMNQVMPGAVGPDHKVPVNWESLYASVEEWSVEVEVSLSADELKDKKRADLQDMLVVLAQNAPELGPEAAQKVQEITNMLLEDKAPLTKPMNGGSQITAANPMQMPTTPMMPAPSVDQSGGLTQQPSVLR